MKVLLVGLGRWGSEVVDRFHYIHKKTMLKRPIDVLTFGRLDPIKRTGFFLSFAEFPSNFVFIMLYIYQLDQERYSVVFSFYVFLISFAVINILMYLFLLSPLGPRLLKIRLTEEDRETFGKIREELELPDSTHVVTEGEKEAIYKYLQFQKKALLTTLILSVIASCIAAVFFYRDYYEIIVPVLQFIGKILSQLGPLGEYLMKNKPLVEYIITSIGIPLILSYVLRYIIMLFYLPQMDQRDLGKKKAEKILRSNVECVGVSLHDDIGDLRHIETIRIIPEKRRDVKEVLRDQILYFFDKKVTKEGKVYDAIVFFGIAGSDIVHKFSEVVPFFKRALIEPMWFYMRFTKNFLTEENQRAVKKILTEMEYVFAEEETGRIFRFYPDEEDYVRERILERLFAIGECKKTQSIRAIDVGNVKSMARKNTFSTFAYGYLEDIPEEMKDNYKLMTELYTLTMEERSLCDLDMGQTEYALATVKRQTNEPESGPVYDYDAVADLLWEKFGENIQVYDIEYVLYNVKEMTPVELDEVGVPMVDTIGNRVLAIIREDDEGNPQPIFDPETKRLLIRILDYKNLLVENVKLKELWIIFSGIEPERILDKYMPKGEYQKDFFGMIGRGAVMDLSMFSRIPPESLERFVRERSSYRIGNQYVSPFLFQETNLDFAMKCLETVFIDADERRENAEKLISAYNSIRVQIDPIIGTSDSVLSTSRVYVHDLMKAISSKTGMKEDAFSTRILAEMAWLSHSMEVPIITLGLKGIEPELLSVYRKMVENFDVEPENLTERYRGVLREWELSGSEIIPEFSDLYLINIHLGYGSGEEGITITAMEYMGGVSGRIRRKEVGVGSGSERESRLDRGEAELH